MSVQGGIPKQAMVVLKDLAENCLRLKGCPEGALDLGKFDGKAKGLKDVLVMAHREGPHGGFNYCDEEAVGWITSVLEMYDCNVTTMWVEEPTSLHNWRYNPIVKGAVAGADIMINLSSELVTEEMSEFRDHIEECDTWMVRMFPVTTKLLMTDWAATPYELLINLRQISSEPFNKLDQPFIMTDPNGTHLEGFTTLKKAKDGIPSMPYDSWRWDASHYLPFPEWCHPPIQCYGINGVFKFHEMLSWWPRYIGLPPVWDNDIEIEIEDCKMVNFKGGKEADLLNKFFIEMESKLGPDMWKFDAFHFGTHPNAHVTEFQCPNATYRRIIDHSDCCNLHVHVGSAGGKNGYYIYPHITGDIRNATLKVGDTMVYEDGFLCCQEDERLAKIMEKYPGRPGVQTRPSKLKVPFGGTGK